MLYAFHDNPLGPGHGTGVTGLEIRGSGLGAHVAYDPQVSRPERHWRAARPARTWKACQSVCSAEDSVGERRRQLWRIPSNEETDRFEIIGRLGRPPYLSHFAIRCRTSS